MWQIILWWRGYWDYILLGRWKIILWWRGWLKLYCGGELSEIILCWRSDWDYTVRRVTENILWWKGDWDNILLESDWDYIELEDWLTLYCGGGMMDIIFWWRCDRVCWRTEIILCWNGDWNDILVERRLKLYCIRGGDWNYFVFEMWLR